MVKILSRDDPNPTEAVKTEKEHGIVACFRGGPVLSLGPAPLAWPSGTRRDGETPSTALVVGIAFSLFAGLERLAETDLDEGEEL